MNKAVLVGRIVRDPELRFSPGSGIAVSRFTVAVNRQFKKDETDFISCVAFGKQAETISQYFVKGQQIALSGSIRTGSYEKDGVKHYTTDVAVDSFDFIDSKGNSEGYSQSNETGPFDGVGFDDDIEPDSDNDMPF